MTGVPAA
jgi:hypothetical protein